MLKNAVLIGAGDKYTVDETGGAESASFTPAGTIEGTAITSDQMPSHTHTQKSCDTQGSHTHTQKSCDTQGAHSHYGSDGSSVMFMGYNADTSVSRARVSTTITGTAYRYVWSGTAGVTTADGSNLRSWSATNSNGGHSHTVTLNDNGGHAHTVTLNNTGGGKAHDHKFTGTAANIKTMMPYIGKYIWQRDS